MARRDGWRQILKMFTLVLWSAKNLKRIAMSAAFHEKDEEIRKKICHIMVNEEAS